MTDRAKGQLRPTRRQVGQGLIGGLALAGLGSRASAQTPTELSFWTWRQEDRSQYATLFGEFTAKNPDIRLTFQGFEPQNYGTALSTALAAGRGPDVIHIRAYGGTEQFARANYLEPLTRETVPELANFTEAALGSVSLRADKKVYAVPFASQTLGLFINRDLFQRNNLTVPTTWSSCSPPQRPPRIAV